MSQKQKQSELLKDLNQLIADISTELDVNVLCHKILTNICALIDADRGSLFLTQGAKDNAYLVSKLFDVTQTSLLEDCLHTEDAQFIVPFGKGIAGAVALERTAVNIKDAYKDSRFNKEVDKQTKYITRNILAMPIIDNRTDDVIGVAQMVNKTTGDSFTEKDEDLFKKYLAFAAIALANAQIIEMSAGELKQNKLLLSLAKGIVQEQTNVDRVLKNMIKVALNLVSCFRCNIYLVDVHSPKEVDIKRAFQMNKENPESVVILSLRQLDTSPSAQFAKDVVKTNAMMTIDDATTDAKYASQPLIESDKFRIKNLLSVPVTDGQQKVIGVVQMLNKTTGKPFDDNDVNTTKTFSIFCGLAVHNCHLNENNVKLVSRNLIQTELHAYHATPSQTEVHALLNAVLQSADYYRIYSYDFNIHSFEGDAMSEVILKIFTQINVCEQFDVKYEKLCRWILTIKKHYRGGVMYHNWTHAVTVTQSLFVLLFGGSGKSTAGRKLGKLFEDIEIFALLIAALGHCIDHRGVSNRALIKQESPMVNLYKDCYMQRHHFDQLQIILAQPDTDILSKLTTESYRKAMTVIENAIISVDVTMCLKKMQMFADKATADQKWKNPHDRDLLRAVVFNAASVSLVTKPWSLQGRIEQHWVYSAEFEDVFTPAMLDLSQATGESKEASKEEMIRKHIDYIEQICLPVYQNLAKLDSGPGVTHLINNLNANCATWRKQLKE